MADSESIKEMVNRYVELLNFQIETSTLETRSYWINDEEKYKE